MGIEDRCPDCPGHPRCCWDRGDRTPKSEVATLMARISAEYAAALSAMNGPACVAQHRTITARMEGIERARQALQNEVGLAQSVELTMQAMENAPEVAQ